MRPPSVPKPPVGFGRFPAHWQVRWSAGLPPVLRVHPPCRLVLRVPDASAGQLGPRSRSADLAEMDYSRVDAAVGPIFVTGAEPGDALAVHLRSIEVGTWGWTGIFREFGVLQGRFGDELVTWSIRDDRAVPTSGFLRRVEIPVRAMLGWLGTAPAEGDFDMIVPRRTGGNMDSRLHGPGSTVVLPVEVPGALLSIGDPHAAMGDGEVCGTGIETPARVTLDVSVRRGGSTPFPYAEVPKAPPDLGPLWVTSGIGPDLPVALRAAVLQMVDLLVDLGLDPREAYLLTSLVGHLRIAEAVDLPNYVVTLSFPQKLRGLPRPRGHR